MIVLLSFIMAVAPAVLLVLYYLRNDRLRPEPKGAILRIFFLGVIFTLPTVSLELLVGLAAGHFQFNPMVHYFIRAFIVAALCEELFKLTIVIHFAYPRVMFDEVMDGIIYCIVASLGFACMENILFTLGGGLGTAIVRAITAIPLHATASGIMGYYIGLAKFASSRRRETVLIYKGLAIAVLIHGVYDFLLFATPDLSLVASIGVYLLLLFSFLLLRNRINLAISLDIRAGRTVAAADVAE